MINHVVICFSAVQIYDLSYFYRRERNWRPLHRNTIYYFQFFHNVNFQKSHKGKFYMIIILSYQHVFFGWAVEYLLAAIAENDIKHFILFSDKAIPLYDQKRALCVVQVSGAEISITFLFDALLAYTVQNDILKSAFKLTYKQLFALCSFVVILQNNQFSRRWMHL